MEYKPAFENLGINPEEIFIAALFKEYIFESLFESRNQNYFQFTAEEQGDAVCLIENRDTNQEKQYNILLIPHDRKFHNNPIIPSTILINYSEPIVNTWLEDKHIVDIKNKIKQGGTILGKILNTAFMDVLLASATRITQLTESLDDAMSDVFSEQVKSGFHPNVFIFPEYLEARLVQQGTIIRDRYNQNSHYVGTTSSGQSAYSINELPKNMALIFDSTIAINIGGEKGCSLERIGPFTPGIHGYAYINPIIRNTSGVVAIKGIDLINEKKGTFIKQDLSIPYIDIDRINELISINSTKYDLIKLIKLCNEINTCFANECYFATIMLTRAMLDHIPPIFGFTTFEEVVNNYKGSTSFKNQMRHLQASLRKIADAHLHTIIRSREVLPNKTQVNYSNDIDILLSEIVRILK